MKVTPFIVGTTFLLGLVTVGLWFIASNDEASPLAHLPHEAKQKSVTYDTADAETVSSSIDNGLTLNTTSNAEAVFRRAFWKHPSTDDKIMNATRYEWSDADGVAQWAWYLETELSSAMEDYLFGQNAFNLTRQESWNVPSSDALPDWFPRSAEGYEVHASRGVEMVMLRDIDSGKVFAYSNGGGFSKSYKVPENTGHLSANLNTGRLSPTSPPDNQHP